jgi:hypothetical protein
MIQKAVIILLIIISILIVVFMILPIVFYQRRQDRIEINCDLQSSGAVIKGHGFCIMENILSDTCRQKLVDKYLMECRRKKNLNEDKNLSFYSNVVFLKQLSAIVGQQLYPVNSLDLQRCWIRYYFEGMKAQYYENYHHDIKRYNSHMKQYRLVIPLYDTSNSIFTIDKFGEFPFKQNMGVFLEAGNCLHKVNFTRGERLVLIMDFITRQCDNPYGHYECRGVEGYLNWIRDVVWRIASSTYYKFSNSFN